MQTHQLGIMGIDFWLTLNTGKRKLSSMKKRLIVNSDDFGLCEGVNKAVQRAHKHGILTSATIMAGAHGTEQALEMAKELPGLGVGIHLNLTEGNSICKDRQVSCLLNEKGEFKYSAGKLAKKSLFSSKIRQAIEMELTAQIESLIQNRLRPTHFDSHKHVHTFPTIYSIVVKLAKKFEIAAIRWPCETTKTCSSGWPLPSKDGKTRTQIITMMARVNRCQSKGFIKNMGFYGIAHTGKADDNFWQAVCKYAKPEIAEVMTHPGYTDGLDPEKTRLVEERVVELESLCSEKVKAAIEDAGIELINYGDI